MKKLIISGSGKGVRGVGQNWMAAILVAAGCIILGTIAANFLGYTTRHSMLVGTVTERNELYWVFLGLGFIGAIMVICNIAWQNIIVQKTEISVYESGIAGTGVDSKYSTDAFSPEKYKTETFSWSFEQISSVSVTENDWLVINAHGKKLMIASNNVKEIAEVMNDKLRK